VIELRIEMRRLMREVDAAAFGDFFEMKAITADGRLRIENGLPSALGL